MIIQWLGLSSFKIITKNNQGEFTVATDPFSDSSGQKMPRFQADIVTVSQADDESRNNIEALRGEPFLIHYPGEYETKGIFIYGIKHLSSKQKYKQSLYKIISEDIAVAHLGSATEPLTNEQLGKLGNVDILLLGVPTKESGDIKTLTELISQIDPRIVIPMNYSIGDQATSLGSLDDFLKNCGLKSESMEKLKIAKKELLAEETKVVILTA